MPLLSSATKKRRLGELLMDVGLVSEQQLRAALSEQRRWGGRLGHTLVQLGFVDEQAMATALSRQLGLPVVDLDSLELAPDLARHLRYETAERYGVCPLSADPKRRMIQVATSDPTNADAAQALTFQTGMKVDQVVASAGSIDRALRRVYARESRTVPLPVSNINVLAEKLDSLAGRVADLEAKLESERRLVQQLLERVPVGADDAPAPPPSEERAAEPRPS